MYVAKYINGDAELFTSKADALRVHAIVMRALIDDQINRRNPTPLTREGLRAIGINAPEFIDEV